MLYVYTESGLLYKLALIAGRSPLSVERNISSIALSTTPERCVTCTPQHERPEVTVTSRVIGNRRVSREELSYEAYIPSADSVEFRRFDFDDPTTYFAVLDENRPNDAHTGNGDGDARSRSPLRLVEHSHEGGEVRYRLQLDTSLEDRGVFVLGHRFLFDCTGGCLLYEMVVTKPLPYFREDLYTISDDAIVPFARHRQSGQQYVGFVR